MTICTHYQFSWCIWQMPYDYLKENIINIICQQKSLNFKLLSKLECLQINLKENAVSWPAQSCWRSDWRIHARTLLPIGRSKAVSGGRWRRPWPVKTNTSSWATDRGRAWPLTNSGSHTAPSKPKVMFMIKQQKLLYYALIIF